MKILVVTDLNIYAIGHSFVKALKELGHEVKTFDLQNSIEGHVKLGKIGAKIHAFWPVEAWVRKGNRELAVFCQEFKPDHVIVSGNVPVLFSTLAFWKSILPNTTLTLFWPDTLTNLQQTQLNSSVLYDQIASYSNAAIPIFYKLGFKNAHWLPFASDTDLLGGLGTKISNFEYDFTFIGGWRPERERMMLAVLKTFPDLKIIIRGSYWSQKSSNKIIKDVLIPKSIYGKEFGAFLRSSRINLNVIDDTNFPAANMRFFEVPAVGGLQICSSCPEQENIFIDKEHILYFNNENDLCNQVDFVIKNPEKAQLIRTAAHQLVTSGHTYAHRMSQLVGQ